MTKRNAFSIGFLLFFSIIIAQSDFRDGYIITTNLDTIFGLIDNKSYYENSHFCDFKNKDKDSIIRFYPDQLLGYRYIDGKYYISEEINNQKLFLEYLINGNLDIYFLQDSKGNNHYYASKDSTRLQELNYRTGIKNINGQDKYYESKQYIGPLSYLTNDCPGLKDDIYRLNEPNHKKLISFAEKYHSLTCGNDSCIIYEKEIPRKIILCLYGGSNIFFSNISELDRKIYPSAGFTLLFQ
jgi:hypothetical protein